MFALLYDPLSEIRLLKRVSYARVLVYLLSASLFETVGILFFAWRYFNHLLTPNVVVNGVVFILFSLILLHLVMAFFLSVSLHVLDGRGGYYEGLATLVAGSVAPAILLFFAGALAFIPFGVIASAVLLLYGVILGASTCVRSAKELFELDYAGVLIGILITKCSMVAIFAFAYFLR